MSDPCGSGARQANLLQPNLPIRQVVNILDTILLYAAKP
jgi:hypothetical protein